MKCIFFLCLDIILKVYFDDIILLFRLIKNLLFLNVFYLIFIFFVEWQGKNCIEDVDECFSRFFFCYFDYIYNCINVQGDYICYCYLGFFDKNCFININECSFVICYNGGICIDGINSYICNCILGKS